MDFSKLKNKLLILLCCFVIVFPFWCVRGFCAYIINPYSINDWSLSGQTVVERPGRKFIQYNVIAGETYTINFDPASNPQLILRNNSDDYFKVGDVTTTIFTLTNLDTFTFKVPNNVSVIGVITPYSTTSSLYMTNYDNAMQYGVDKLPKDIDIWNIFDISINYIVIAVLVAFGFFIITRVIKKISKGKEGL